MICPACGATTTQVVYSISAIPIHSCVLLDSQEAARLFPKRDLALAFCDNCGFAFNHIFDEKVINYSTNFEESQHFSETFSGFAKSLAQQVAEKCDVRGRHILEIGCGKGEFLRELCRVGGATGLGIDPAYRFDEGRAIDVPGVEFVSDYFTPLYEHLNADTILCRHTLEHIAPVDEFVKSLRRLIGFKDDVSIFFETPDAKRVFVEGAFWDIYYEHCSYFSPGAHARLFRRNGFDVTGLEVVYDSQYIIQYAKLASGGRQTEPGTLRGRPFRNENARDRLCRSRRKATILLEDSRLRPRCRRPTCRTLGRRLKGRRVFDNVRIIKRGRCRGGHKSLQTRQVYPRYWSPGCGTPASD